MAYENIRFSKPNMTYYGGYFYFFDDSADALYQKLADGDTVFTYLLDTVIDNTIESLEYDSLFFWTLEQDGSNLLIKRWYIDNFLCKLDKSYKFPGFTSTAFSIEYYTSTLSTTISGGETFITIDDNFEPILSSGLKIYLGEDDLLESNYISSISGSTIQLQNSVIYPHNKGDKFYVAVNILIVLDDYLVKYPIESPVEVSYHWDGDHNAKTGLWEYIIASGVELDEGVYTVKFSAYDADDDHEIALRIESTSDTFDVIARREGNNSWVSQVNLLYIPVSGTYTIKGRQLEDSTYSWGVDNITLETQSLYKSSTEKGYWAGDHTNKAGNWEYTIASNVDFDVGTYYVIFDAYDNDVDEEIGLRLDGVGGIIDIKAHNIGDNSWVTQTGIFNISVSGSYDIKGRQYQSASYNWGIDCVIIHKVETMYDKIYYGDFDNIKACTFNKIKGVSSKPQWLLMYNKDTNLKFLDIGSMNLLATATIDNTKTNNDIITIYDLAVDDTNIFRLQKEANYYDHDYSWSDYNYVLSTSRRFVDTINVSAYPVILPANAVNTAKISIIVNDQYGDGIVNKPVFVTDDDDVGFITIPIAYTDYFFGTGEAVTYYKAGIAIRTVTIEGTATQFD